MQVKQALSAAALLFFVGAQTGAMAQAWKLPEEIAPKSETAPGASTSTPAASGPATAEAAPAPVDKAAKKKECKAQAAANRMHGKHRRQFLDECEKS